MNLEVSEMILRMRLGVLFIFLCVNIYTQTITIDINTEYQTISGFGGMNHTTWIRDLDEDSREKAFGNDPGKIGLSILRIHLDPNSIRFNLELATAKYAIGKGAIVFATPWNAPGTLLDPINPLRVDPSKYGEYVDHLNSFNTYMNNNGVPLFAISVQNEPDWGEWTRWSSSEMLDFVSNYAQDIENTVMAPESFQFKRAYTDSLLNDSTAASHIDIVGGHIYGGGLFDYPLARSKGKEVWMTEHLTGHEGPEVNDWPLALDMATEINNCMKANFNAYVWWYIRRYYSFIDEANNITQKGYVMSQFSKFIRPQAVRVDANVSSAVNIDATAYKTDTSLVIVVINRNSTGINLDFNIQNGTFDTLTKFTTSAFKNVQNDGSVSISSGIFNSTVDASSITTFSTYAGSGGKYDNITPIVDLGSDTVIIDSNDIGNVTLTFNSSNASDPDGNIINYNWSMNDASLGNNASLSFNVNLGIHDLILTVTDNDGAIGSDTISLIVKSLYNTDIWLEAECGEVGQMWQTNEDENASNNLYVNTPAGTESLSAASANANDHIVYNFYVEKSDSYKVWGRVICPNANDDSFWIKMDNGSWTNWNSIPAGSDWHWDDVHGGNPDSPVSYYLNTGLHTLTICYREDGALFDKLLITNKDIVPSGSGGESENCSVGQNEITYSDKPDFSIFPNPAKNEINIASDFEFNAIEIFTLDGRKILHQDCYDLVRDKILPINLNPGIYIIAISNGYIMRTNKLIVK